MRTLLICTLVAAMGIAGCAPLEPTAASPDERLGLYEDLADSHQELRADVIRLEERVERLVMLWEHEANLNKNRRALDELTRGH